MPVKKRKFVRFLLSKVFWKHTGILILAFILLIVIVQLALRNYTDHGEELQVPNLTGMELTAADKLCYEQELKWIIQDSTYIRDVPGGVILDQYPPSGFRVKRNRKIYLTTSSWYPEMIPMPKAYDMSYRQAKRILESQGLGIDSLESVPYFARTYVMRQKYKGEVILEGTPIEKGSAVVLVLGQGLSNETDLIPDLLGLTRDIAADLAMDLHFNIGAVVFDQTVLTEEDSLTAMIYKQYPEHQEKQARLGSSIDIWLTMDSIRLFQADSVRFRIDSLAMDSLYPLN